MRFLFTHTLSPGSFSSIWIIMFSLKENTDRKNPFVCARWCKISFRLPPTSTHSLSFLLKNHPKKKIFTKEKFIDFLSIFNFFFRIFYFVRFLMGWLCEKECEERVKNWATWNIGNEGTDKKLWDSVMSEIVFFYYFEIQNHRKWIWIFLHKYYRIVEKVKQ